MASMTRGHVSSCRRGSTTGPKEGFQAEEGPRAAQHASRRGVAAPSAASHLVTLDVALGVAGGHQRQWTGAMAHVILQEQKKAYSPSAALPISPELYFRWHAGLRGSGGTAEADSVAALLVFTYWPPVRVRVGPPQC